MLCIVKKTIYYVIPITYLGDNKNCGEIHIHFRRGV